MDDEIIEQIRQLAYFKWMEAGCTGDSLTFWLEAKEILGYNDDDRGSDPHDKK